MINATTRLRQIANRLLHENASPSGLGIAVGVGVLFACTPFFGFQLWIALGVAWMFRLNKVAVAVGTQFSLPPLIPFIVFASAWIGEWIVHRRRFTLSIAELRGASATEIATRIGAAWLVGGLVLGAICGVVVGLIVYAVAKRRAQTASPSEGPAHPSGQAAP